MSVITSYILRPVDGNINLMQKLKEDGLVHDGNRLRVNKGDYIIEPCKDVLDYSKCNPEEYEKIKENVLKKRMFVRVPVNDTGTIEMYERQGFVADKDSEANSYISVVRNFRPGELDAKLSQRLSENHNGIMYSFNYHNDNTAAYLISKTYPDITFEYVETIENDVVTKGTLKDGSFEEEPREFFIAALNEKNTGISGYVKIDGDSFELVQDNDEATKTNIRKEINELKDNIRDKFKEKYGADYELYVADKYDWQLVWAISEHNNEFEQNNDERDL